MTGRTKITLDESELPRQWYNVIPDLPSPPPPPLQPGTLQPVGPEDLAPLFPMALIAQEVTAGSYVPIPEEVLDVYRRDLRAGRGHRARAGADDALAAVIEEAKRCAQTGEEKVILTALCGHGHFDMSAYQRYLSGEMDDFELSQDRIDAALSKLPSLAG